MTATRVHKSKSQKRTVGILGAAVLTAAVALPVAVASPAHAAGCSGGSTPEHWYGSCVRVPADGDDGGVSGNAWVASSQNDDGAGLSFTAKGEDFVLGNYTKYPAYFSAWYKKGGTWHSIFKGVRLDKDQTLEIPKSLAENYTVDLQTCLDYGSVTGCARISTLRT